ncbi:multidrug efflux SMR transporter [Mesosutterella sp. OilRF-GAM-744-9]|uniref:Guanidinium exporter n=1 Tax=Mesosutterella porci TaxID=2915351 RepID=A0ABS9MTB2_9BURK|nr:multidrug efflux SMR transporter [Mesosutterella sp. oilRF-744-WT-GAM-9]MCG5031857.1 multidrug efflux SMR transporter [Mesosutterella sp. oilRF-744-WT-GAM-9]MCI6530536.1 multidrug efflux SMR transporter [Mesosutterella sp.]
MSWAYLFIAGLCEIWWAVGLKFTEGFTKLVPSVVTIVGMIASFYFLSGAVKTLPLGIAYAIWTGIGSAGTIVASVLLFGDELTLGQIGCLVMIVGGIVGLKLLG